MRRLNRVFILIVVLALSACISSVPPGRLDPTGPISKGPRVDFSGVYCFVNDPANVHAFGMSLKAIPFVDLEALPPGSEIRVLHRNGDFIRFSYLKSEGRQVDFTTKLRGTKAHWSSGKLIVPPPPRYEGVRLGISNSREEHSIYRMRDGRLILSSMSSEAGMAFLVVPFRERSEIVVELAPKPAGRACPAPAH